MLPKPKAAIRSRRRGVVVVVEGDVEVGGVVVVVMVAVVAVHMVDAVGEPLESAMAVAWEELECARGSEGGVVAPAPAHSFSYSALGVHTTDSTPP